MFKSQIFLLNTAQSPIHTDVKCDVKPNKEVLTFSMGGGESNCLKPTSRSSSSKETRETAGCCQQAQFAKIQGALHHYYALLKKYLSTAAVVEFTEIPCIQERNAVQTNLCRLQDKTFNIVQYVTVLYRICEVYQL